MNAQNLIDALIAGRLFIVGEYRNGRVQSADAFDDKSGEKIQRHEIVYAVECGNTFGNVLIFRRLPGDVDVAKVEINLIKGRRYAFELDGFTRRATGITAYLSYRQPEPLD